jgi:indolepyruvate ferredoxin oxidoreductase
MVGKADEQGKPLVPWVGELTPLQLAGIVARRLDAEFRGLNLGARVEKLKQTRPTLISVQGATRTPYFCSGCPHNTSTRLPEGSQALAGIGCHFMANWMDRDTDGLIQMGGEGVNWTARSRFNGGQHIFQNLGDGTYYHSGSLAIRQAVAANTNITYKILFNDAVAMTGGQPVDGPLSVQSIAHSVRAEGVERIALVSDEPEQFSLSDFPRGTSLSHRRDMDAVQRELREIPGVTVLIYAQTCATEKRRRRKRGLLEEPKKRVVINELVCEGCGDCSVESNCLSVIPKETAFGRKRQIDQNNCNKDYSCLNGFCPSFVTVEGDAASRQSEPAAAIPAAPAVPQPDAMPIMGCFDLLVTGVGGTGVITVGALITMAAHLEGKGASVLDFMGFAQKFGPVLSYIRIAASPGEINQVRIEDARADALIGCDLVVSSSPKASRTYRAGHTRAVLNTAEMATGDFVRNRDANLQGDKRLDAIQKAVGGLHAVDANQFAESLLGDSIYANVLLLGAAFQAGLVPVSEAALLRAIELNAVQVDRNKAAFAWGRAAYAKPELVQFQLTPRTKLEDESLQQVILRRENFLTDYQDRALAERYRKLVDRVAAAELGVADGEHLTRAAALAYFRLLSYKDEYEVARLHTNSGFIEQLRKDYGTKSRLRFHLAPPLMSSKKDARGRPRKKEFGAWVVPAFRMLAGLRRLRGSALDVFGYTAERRMERALIIEFEQSVNEVLAHLSAQTHKQACAVLSFFLDVRGYGPVKEAAVAKVRPLVAEALASMRRSADESHETPIRV